jgi:hypothetical protein
MHHYARLAHAIDRQFCILDFADALQRSQTFGNLSGAHPVATATRIYTEHSAARVEIVDCDAMFRVIVT